MHASLVEQEFRGRSCHIGITHQCEGAIVQNQPLSVHARRGHRVVFARKSFRKMTIFTSALDNPASRSATYLTIA